MFADHFVLLYFRVRLSAKLDGHLFITESSYCSRFQAELLFAQGAFYLEVIFEPLYFHHLCLWLSLQRCLVVLVSLRSHSATNRSRGFARQSILIASKLFHGGLNYPGGLPSSYLQFKWYVTLLRPCFHLLPSSDAILTFTCEKVVDLLKSLVSTFVKPFEQSPILTILLPY